MICFWIRCASRYWSFSLNIPICFCNLSMCICSDFCHIFCGKNDIIDFVLIQPLINFYIHQTSFFWDILCSIFFMLSPLDFFAVSLFLCAALSIVASCTCSHLSNYLVQWNWLFVSNTTFVNSCLFYICIFLSTNYCINNLINIPNQQKKNIPDVYSESAYRNWTTGSVCGAYQCVTRS